MNELTTRECEVLQALWDYNDKEAAVLQALCITQSTFKTHLTNIYQKLQVTTRASMMIHALKQNLLPSITITYAEAAALAMEQEELERLEQIKIAQEKARQARLQQIFQEHQRDMNTRRIRA